MHIFFWKLSRRNESICVYVKSTFSKITEELLRESEYQQRLFSSLCSGILFPSMVHFESTRKDSCCRSKYDERFSPFYAIMATSRGWRKVIGFRSLYRMHTGRRDHCRQWKPVNSPPPPIPPDKGYTTSDVELSFGSFMIYF